MNDWYQALGSFNAQLMNATNMAYASKTSSQDRAFTREMYQRSLEDERENWQMVNEYNLPSAQMQRLKDAELNPYLIYGNGAQGLVASGEVGSGQVSQGRGHVPKIDPYVGMQLEQVKIARDVADSQISLNDAQAANQLASARNLDTSSARNELDLNWNKDTYQLRIDYLEAESNLKVQLSHTEVSKRNEIEANCRLMEENANYLRGHLENETNLNEARIKQIEQEVDNSIKLCAKQCVALDAQARQSYAQAWLADVQAKLQGDSRYQNAKIQEAIGNAAQAIANGNTAEIESGLRAIDFLMRPEPGSAGAAWQKNLDIWLGGLTRPIGYVFGGSVSFGKKI